MADHKTLPVSSILMSLNVLGTIQSGDRVDCTTEYPKKMSPTYSAKLWRIIHGDGRFYTVKWLEQLMSDTVNILHIDSIMNCLETKKMLLSSLLDAIPGIQNLMSLYADDEVIGMKIHHVLHGPVNLALNILINSLESKQNMCQYMSNSSAFTKITSKYSSACRPRRPPPPPPSYAEKHIETNHNAKCTEEINQ